MATTKRWDFLAELETRLSLIRTANGYNTEIGKFIHRGMVLTATDGSLVEVPVTASDYSDYPFIRMDMLDGATTHDGRQAPFHIEMNIDITGVVWAVDNQPQVLENVHQDLENGIRFDKLFSPGVQVRYRGFSYNAREVGEHIASVTINMVARVPHCFEYPANE